ncbi:hypothetical protein [Serratia liquefaciens]|uniref:hypothetical protein n=1 Tax=Serratia liquefaciens TaxID=614 RepID=UPI0015A20861|nr:hypothetical protein [Serratia liquefaciens]
MDIDNLTGNETAEEIEALLDSFGEVEISDAVVVPAATEKPIAQVASTVDQTKTGDTGVTPPPGATVEQTEASNAGAAATEALPKGIATQDGKHVIPYAVLEAARAESRRNAEGQQRANTELEQTKRQLQMLSQQVNNAGLIPAKLPEESQITPEQLAKIRNEFPDLSGVFETLVQKIDYLQKANPVAQPAPVESTGNPVTDALKATPELEGWQSADPDRFSLAVHLDEKLQADPAWKDKPLTERFSEVVKRTKAAYGESVEAPQPSVAVQTAQPTAEELQKLADDKLAAAKASVAIPTSPSDLGSPSTHQPTLLEQAAGADHQQLTAMFSGMSEAQIDALLEQSL